MLLRISLAAVLLGMLAQTVAAQPFHHPFGEWREYNRDWLAVCPDQITEAATSYRDHSCYASTYSRQRNGSNLPAYSLTIIRNRLTGELDIAFTLADDAREPDTSRPLTLLFPSEAPLRLRFASDLETRFSTSNQYFVADQAGKAALLERLKLGSAVDLTVPLAGSTKAWTIHLSLRGLNASLDFMDAYSRKVAQY